MMIPRCTRFLTALWVGGFAAMAAAWALEEVPPEGKPRPETARSAPQLAVEREAPGTREGPAKVVVIPVRDQIAKPVLYVLRRGLKDAIANEADLVVLDMETPGGRLDVTFDILEAIDRFPGATATFINQEAISAGAFISAVTDDIYFAPTGVIGAAAPVMSSGGEIDESMKQKIVSYLRARVRAISEGHAYRGEVISAMIDSDYVLEIEGEVLKPEGELLSLTATEAAQTYGDPPEPLLAAGIAETVDDLLDARFGAGNYEVLKLETTWSEDLAALLNSISPVLLGLGFLGLFIEFKTPGFGVFGILGGILVLVVFFGHYVAGLSGHEPILFFVLGVMLVLLELLFFPGILVVALSGVTLMLGSLVWSMADFWPNEPISFSSGVLVGPLTNLLISLVIALVGILLVWRYLPTGWIIRTVGVGGAGKLAATGGVMKHLATEPAADSDPLVGQEGVAITDLFPIGRIEVEGRVYDARVQVSDIRQGETVRVVARKNFELVVERTEP